MGAGARPGRSDRPGTIRGTPTGWPGPRADTGTVGRNRTSFASRVREAQNTDGGFGPRTGLPSEPEPTALATIALDDARRPGVAGRAPGLRRLGAVRRRHRRERLGDRVRGDRVRGRRRARAGARPPGGDPGAGRPVHGRRPARRVLARMGVDRGDVRLGRSDRARGPGAAVAASRRPGDRRRPRPACAIARRWAAAGTTATASCSATTCGRTRRRRPCALVAFKEADPELEGTRALDAPPLWRDEREGGLSLAMASAALELRGDEDAGRSERALFDVFERHGVHGRCRDARVGGDRHRSGALARLGWRADGDDGPRNVPGPIRVAAGAVGAAALVGERIVRTPARPAVGRRGVRASGDGAGRRARATSYDGDLEGVVGEGLRAIGTDVRGARVVLKPNLVEFDRSTAINTDPRLVAAAVVALRRLGAADVVVGEGPGHRRDTQYVVTSSGLLEALDAVDARFVDLNTDAVARVPLHSRYTALGDLWLPRTIADADVVISMPKMKTHHWAGVTLSLKNCFGCVPGRVYGWPKNALHWAGLEQCDPGRGRRRSSRLRDRRRHRRHGGQRADLGHADRRERARVRRRPGRDRRDQRAASWGSIPRRSRTSPRRGGSWGRATWTGSATRARTSTTVTTDFAVAPAVRCDEGLTSPRVRFPHGRSPIEVSARPRSPNAKRVARSTSFRGRTPGPSRRSSARTSSRGSTRCSARCSRSSWWSGRSRTRCSGSSWSRTPPSASCRSCARNGRSTG